MTVKIVSIKDGGYYKGPYASGNTVDVVLQKGDVFASCEGVLNFETDAESLEQAFEDWSEMGTDGEEGYACWKA